MTPASPASSSDDARLYELIGRFYEAALDGSMWSGLADQIAAAFDAPSAVLKVDQAHGNQVDILELTDNFSIAHTDPNWADYWHQNDLWVEQSRRYKPGQVITSEELLSPSKLEDTGFYQEWLRPLHIHSMIGAVLPLPDQAVGVIGIHRPRGHASSFHEADRRRLTTLLPHIHRAFELRQRLAQQDFAQRTAGLWLDTTGIATFVVDKQGKLLHANLPAERLLQEGTALLSTAGRLGTSQPGTTTALLQQIQHAAQIATGRPASALNALSLRHSDGQQLTVMVAPLPVGNTADTALPARPLVAIFAHAPEQLHLPADTLRALFGFTSTEARLADALAMGHSLEQSATTLGIGIGTARTHLKGILTKTGTHRQAEMVSLLLRTAVPLSLGTSRHAKPP